MNYQPPGSHGGLIVRTSRRIVRTTNPIVRTTSSRRIIRLIIRLLVLYLVHMVILAAMLNPDKRILDTHTGAMAIAGAPSETDPSETENGKTKDAFVEIENHLRGPRFDEELQPSDRCR